MVSDDVIDEVEQNEGLHLNNQLCGVKYCSSMYRATAQRYELYRQ